MPAKRGSTTKKSQNKQKTKNASSEKSSSQPSSDRVAKAFECVKKQCNGIDKILPLYQKIQINMQNSELSPEEVKDTIKMYTKILQLSKGLPTCVFVECGQHMALAVDEILETMELNLASIPADEKAQRTLLLEIQKRRNEVMTTK